VTVSISPEAIATGVSEVCLDAYLTLETVQTRMETRKQETRCVKEGDLDACISVSAISNQSVSATAQIRYTDGVWFKIVVNQLRRRLDLSRNAPRAFPISFL
jgi:hypothetical protein